MAGRNEKGLTVIISPLQSLMQDQVYNLEKINITDAVTINGLLDPIERADAIRRVEEGEAKLLYIAPESLRSKTIERLLLGRNIVRFVIDEAHCFSAWGQDFRVDYLYIGEFIRKICQKKQLKEVIPISCFTATAKQNVVEDIRNYFKLQLGLELELFTASSSRKNLTYKVIRAKDNEKYLELRKLLDSKKCPTIIYASRTKRTEELAERLNQDGYFSRAYHGKMDKKIKSENQKDFIDGNVDIMVATSAFGMGVDKKDVGMVIHYDISDSLENYVQEAGRAGRDQTINAECFVLYDEADLNKHFMLLNQTKISIQEIKQIWRAIKELTRKRAKFSSSALEIARKAGWDDSVTEIETRVKTAINALEEAKYIKRGENFPKVYADSMLVRSVSEASKKINNSNCFSDDEKGLAIQIIARLIKDDTRVDYIADHLGVEKYQVVALIQKLREAQLLADSKDLTAYLDDSNTIHKYLNSLLIYQRLEEFLLDRLSSKENVFSIKELNKDAQESGIKKSSTEKIITLLNFWSVKRLIKKERSRTSKDMYRISFEEDRKNIINLLKKNWKVSEFILNYIDNVKNHDQTSITFSLLELVEQFNYENQLLSETTTGIEVEYALLYLSRTGLLKLEGGFLITYNALSIERLEMDNKIQYKAEDYKRLNDYYEQKKQMIHIVGEYAQKVAEDYEGALQFVEDYFQLEYNTFLKKYFKGQRSEEIKRNITPSKFEELFGTLSVTQLKIVTDDKSPNIVVAAGPGSGKTKILVHKLASLLLMEDVKHEQLLMLTFSRAAATEFKQRLIELIGNAASFVEIKTFHSYCFDLLGRPGNIENSHNVVTDAIQLIEAGEVETSKITKTVLVIDEAQDMDENEFHLVELLLCNNEDMRIIAVGDDDQNIFGFRGSKSIHMKRLLEKDNSKLYELVENYRSKSNLVAYTNAFVNSIHNRMKSLPIVPVQSDYGKISLIKYEGNLIVPVVDKMINDGISKNTCIMTFHNDAALQVTGLLNKKGVKASLIQDREDIQISRIREIRYFCDLLQLAESSYVIDRLIWDSAKNKMKEKFLSSSMLDICKSVIDTFEKSNYGNMFVSDWKMFLEESHLSDFTVIDNEQVCVSTMHKSKGHEFEHVVIILDRYKIDSDEKKRLLYVAMTRAKKTLTIHYNCSYLDQLLCFNQHQIPHMHFEEDAAEYPEANMILLQLSMKDVYLTNYYRTQKYVELLTCGDRLLLDSEGCNDVEKRKILTFSKKFKERLDVYFKNGFCYAKAKVNIMVYWKEEQKENYTLVALPQIELNRIDSK